MADRRGRWALGLGPAGKAVAAGTGALLLLILGVLVWQSAGYGLDASAVPVTEEKHLSPEELQSQLQAQADESRFRVRLNSRPRVVGDQAELLLENPVENKKNLSVSIILNKGEKTLYESGPLLPGAQVLTAELEEKLAPGEYPATAVCTAIDPETGEAAGSQTLVDMVLIVEKPAKASRQKAWKEAFP